MTAPTQSEREERLERENARLREALEWYGNKENYERQYVPRSCGCCSDSLDPKVEYDGGNRAREALKGAE